MADYLTGLYMPGMILFLLQAQAFYKCAASDKCLASRKLLLLTRLLLLTNL